MILQEIFKWSGRLPFWQRDAMRRLWEKGHLAEEDINELLLMLKSEYGVKDPGGTSKIAKPLSRDDISIQTPGGPTVVLNSLHGLKNVNAIAPDQRIDFSRKGVTIIYGENAAGKSGYARVLKSACRARGEIEEILPNILSGDTDNRQAPAAATFEIFIDNEKSIVVEWVEGNSSLKYLTEIAIFDSKCARAYIDDQNEVVYIPYGLDILKQLAKICDILRDRIISELETLASIPDIISELVGEGKPIPSMTNQTSIEILDKLTEFSKSDELRLTELEKEVADLIANDPIEKAKIIRRTKRRYDRLRKGTLLLKTLISKAKLSSLQALYSDMKTAEKASQVAAEIAFKREPLAGAGSQVWKELFKAAKRYSELFAYPDSPFPVIREESRCVLCQQFLDDDAKDRLNRFWNFIIDDVAKEYEKRQNLYRSRIDEVAKIDLYPENVDTELLEEITEEYPEFSVLLVEYLRKIRGRATSIIEASNLGLWDKVIPLGRNPMLFLSRLSKIKEAEATHLEKTPRQEERKRKEKELEELRVKRKANTSRKSLYDHLNRLRLANKLNKCKNACLTTGITNKHSQLSEIALTAGLKKALEKELADLSITHIKLSFKKTGIKGSTFHQLKLMRDESISLSKILSEGEHRVIAIACFLAELGLSPNKSAIVFDDPVSSLDHIWRDNIAKRLVVEAQNRQVIIFTHDIYFMTAIYEEASCRQVSFKSQTIRRTIDKIGLRDERLPWDAKKLGERIAHLEYLASKITKIRLGGPYEDYETNVRDAYGLLRETWESVIEELLFNGVINRFHREIKTLSLNSVEIQDEEFKTIYFEMKKCSTKMRGHSQASAIKAPLPTPEDFKQDISILSNFVKQIKVRKRQTETRRKESIKPPAVS